MRLPIQRHYVDQRLETLPREEIRAQQWGRLTALLRRVWASSAFYRRLFDEARVHPDQIRSWDDWGKRVPFIDKRTLLRDQAEHPPWGRKLMVPEPLIRKHYITSGTSGVGQEVHPMTENDFRSATEVGFFCFTWAGMAPGDLSALFWPLGTMAGGQVAFGGLERFGAHPMVLGLFDSKTKLQRLREFKHQYIWATPVYLTRLTHLAREMGLEPTKELPNLKGIILSTGAFPVEWAEEMEAFWSTRIYDCYGTTQIRSIYAATCEQGVVHDGKRGSYHPAEPFVLAEILDPATNEPVKYGDEGELVITTLYQEAGTIARYDDMLKIRGQNIWPLAVEEVVFGHAEVEEYSGHVYIGADGGEEVTVSIEFKPDAGPSVRSRVVAALPTALRDRTGVRMDVNEVQHGTIPRFEYKAIRWTDDRQKGLTKVKYTEKG